MNTASVDWDKPGHMAAVLSLEVACFPAHCRWTGDMYLEERPEGLLVLDGPEAVVAAVMWHDQEVQSIAVLPGYRGRGVADSLLRLAEINIRLGGFVRGHADIECTNAHSRALFARNGWAETFYRKDLYGPGRDGIHVEKHLG